MRTRAHTGTLIVLFAVLGAVGCTFEPRVRPDPPPDPDADVTGALELPLGEPQGDTLHCEMGDCRDAYRVIAPAPGELVVTVTTPASGMRVSLHGPGRALDQTGWDEPSPHVVRGRVETGNFFVLIQGTGGVVPYEVVATLDLNP